MYDIIAKRNNAPEFQRSNLCLSAKKGSFLQLLVRNCWNGFSKKCEFSGALIGSNCLYHELSFYNQFDNPLKSLTQTIGDTNTASSNLRPSTQ